MSTNTEKDFYHLTVSINKALNGMEAPLKTKHARSIIITIHKAQEAKTFWTVVTRQPLMENRYTAWKFCHLLHKVLREAHHCALRHSQNQKKMILEMGKLWGHLQDDIGYCIKAYSKLLVTKLNFHDKNRIFPGALLITLADIAKFAENDLNLYFQLCVEIFDYLDDIIALQLVIFSCINTYRMSSMTQQGQCRLAPLVCLIEDSNALYDISVRLMFKLHNELPSDVLGGHRTRFHEIFVKLKYFYDNVRPLQYFADLIQVPQLPESSPNFASQVDFGSYIPPVVVVQPDPVVDDLVNTNLSDTSNAVDGIALQRVEHLESIINDKDIVIEQITNELHDFKVKYNELEKNYKIEILELQRSRTALYNELALSKEACANIRLQRDDLELQLTNNPSLNQKVVEEEEKLKLSTEKFSKLRTMYTQIRDEHINLLRQQSELSKSLSKEKDSNSELVLEAKSLNNDILGLQSQIEILTENNVKLLQKIEDQNEHYTKLESVQNTLKMNYEETIQKKKLENLDLNSVVESLKSNSLELENCKLKLHHTEEKLFEAENIIKTKEEEIVKHLQEHKEESEKLSVHIEEIKELSAKDTEILRFNLEETNKTLEEKDKTLKETAQSNTVLLKEKEILDKRYADLQKKTELNEEKLSVALNETESLKDLNQEYYDNIQDLKQSIIKSIEEICSSKLHDSMQMPLEIIPKIISETKEFLHKTTSSSEIPIYQSINKIQDIISLGYAFVKLYDQCDLIYKTTTEIEKGQDILNKVRSICEALVQLLQIMQRDENSIRTNGVVNDIQMKLSDLNELVKDLFENYEERIDFDQLVEIELKEMDIAIEEAAAKIIDLLSNARKKDNGIKLKVNEQILDACTTLMECIKILISKSRVLQNEIISSRKGNATVKDFYKRNSQWSEGLISASKSIAKAANYLVDAANKAVVSESGRNFELIVAAQEIAGCTAQLVIASKVKANPNSQNLTDLTSASRNVTKATGTIVATVKDCNVQLEQATDTELCKLTPSQVKTMEMDLHVKVLELEQALQTKRFQLSAFRRKHYQTTEY